MIKLYISPEGIQRIVLASRSNVMEDIDWTTWKSIRPLVITLDRELRLMNQGTPMAEKEEQSDCS